MKKLLIIEQTTEASFTGKELEKITKELQEKVDTMIGICIIVLPKGLHSKFVDIQ